MLFPSVMHRWKTIHRTKYNLHGNLNANISGLGDINFRCKQLNFNDVEKNTRQCLIQDREMILQWLKTESATPVMY